MRNIPLSLTFGGVVVDANLVLLGAIAKQLALGGLDPTDAEYPVVWLAEVNPDQSLVSLAVHLDPN